MSTHDRAEKTPIVPFHHLSTEICFDQYTLDSLSHHNHGSISILDCWITERLGVRGYFIENALCKRTIHTFWRLYDRSTGAASLNCLQLLTEKTGRGKETGSRFYA
ncbi:BHH_G0046390.mRNA.1.CDS.1 [Saccharomyces cerevisiae]|nr:BHH_G0046390.mRNA.1.CDS.1 [Saccharomyces cerevisiae]CAI7313501.1 BHH_G0046390.mRNA.1.CDS.1 [Saccharomyces cerevisiae]